MNINEEKRKNYIPCDICNMNPVKKIKGGKYNNERKMWLVCDECIKKILDERFDKTNE